MNEQDQYERVCKNEFQDIKNSVSSNNEIVTRIEKRLYVDNGNKSIQTILNEHEIWIRAVKWFSVAVISALVLGFIGLIFWIVRT